MELLRLGSLNSQGSKFSVQAGSLVLTGATQCAIRVVMSLRNLVKGACSNQAPFQLCFKIYDHMGDPGQELGSGSWVIDQVQGTCCVLKITSEMRSLSLKVLGRSRQKSGCSQTSGLSPQPKKTHQDSDQPQRRGLLDNVGKCLVQDS